MEEKIGRQADYAAKVRVVPTPFYSISPLAYSKSVVPSEADSDVPLGQVFIQPVNENRNMVLVLRIIFNAELNYSTKTNFLCTKCSSRDPTLPTLGYQNTNHPTAHYLVIHCRYLLMPCSMTKLLLKNSGIIGLKLFQQTL